MALSFWLSVKMLHIFQFSGKASALLPTNHWQSTLLVFTSIHSSQHHTTTTQRQHQQQPHQTNNQYNNMDYNNMDPQQQHNFATALLAKILPCSEILLNRVVWVLLWSWKAAPVALYETFVSPCLRSKSDTTTGYFNQWWQKAIAIPLALGFYYVLFEFVCQPALSAVNCCGSNTLTNGAAAGILVLHFLSGITMHRYQEARKESGIEETAVVEFEQQQQQQQRYQEQQHQEQSLNMKQLEMGRNNNMMASETNWVAIDDGDLPATGISSSTLPPLDSHIGAPHISPHHSSIEEEPKKKSFWPWKKKKAQVLAHSKTPSTSIV